jgi:HlyD family secretion protein
MTQIKAPFAGKITSLDIQPGDQVSTGTTAFRIDDLSQMLVDLEISEIDVNSIEVGQEVIYSFDAIPGSEYHGRVSEIGTVGNSAQGVVEFKVTTTLTDADEKIKAGMTAIAEIVVEEYENTLLVPNQAVRVVDGNRIIYILAPDGSVAEKTIELGAQSVVYSQVIGGELKAGDKIILNPTELTTFQAGQGGPMGGMFSRGN